MKLIDLDPAFLHRRDDDVRVRVKKIANADGLMFLCPKCFAENGGPVGTHAIICWTPRVPDSARPGPGRWSIKGTGLHDVTLDGARGKTRSVQLTGGCAWHGYVTKGEVTDA